MAEKSEKDLFFSYCCSIFTLNYRPYYAKSLGNFLLTSGGNVIYATDSTARAIPKIFQVVSSAGRFRVGNAVKESREKAD